MISEKRPENLWKKRFIPMGLPDKYIPENLEDSYLQDHIKKSDLAEVARIEDLENGDFFSLTENRKWLKVVKVENNMQRSDEPEKYSLVTQLNKLEISSQYLPKKRVVLRIKNNRI